MNSMGVSAPVLSDQDGMEDLLTQEKYLLSSYGTFLPEASCPQLRQTLTNNFTECAEDQFTIFDEMQKHGWYQTKNAPVPEINAARQKFQGMKGQIAR